MKGGILETVKQYSEIIWGTIAVTCGGIFGIVKKKNKQINRNSRRGKLMFKALTGRQDIDEDKSDLQQYQGLIRDVEDSHRKIDELADKLDDIEDLVRE